jgi:hypothetical protein
VESSKRSSRVEFWQDVLKQFLDSKLSVIDFCSQKGLSVPSFYQWKRKLLPPAKSPSRRGAEAQSLGAEFRRDVFASLRLPASAFPFYRAEQKEKRHKKSDAAH